jgi:tRNA pseudouridine55 synthase
MAGPEGVLVIDKPYGMTSFDVVRRVRKVVKLSRVGHVGTLDPIATGILPVCLNRATKIAPFLVKGEKHYQATLKLGVETDTQDCTGKVVCQRQVPVLEEQYIQKVLEGFTGTSEQTPPMYSAVKVNGTPLYRLARRGLDVPRGPREVTIYRLDVVTVRLPYVSLEVTCSAGTYIRTLCADIGEAIGCGAHLVELKRTGSGQFSIEDCLSLEDVMILSKVGTLEDRIIPLGEALRDFPKIVVGDSTCESIRHGRGVSVFDLKKASIPSQMTGGCMKVLSRRGDLVAIVEPLVNFGRLDAADGRTSALKLVRVFAAS